MTTNSEKQDSDRTQHSVSLQKGRKLQRLARPPSASVCYFEFRNDVHVGF